MANYDLWTADIERELGHTFDGINGTVERGAAKSYAEVMDNLCLDKIISDSMGMGSDSTMSNIADTMLNMGINTILPSMEVIGIAIALAFFIWSLIDIISTDRFNLEYFIKFFGKFKEKSTV